jgi:hypothetical protein
MNKLLSLIFLLSTYKSFAQLVPDSNYHANIKTVKLFQQNNQESVPVIGLNSTDLLELHFDDLDGGYIKNYFYTYVLCNADWTPVELSPFDYIKGFTQNRIFQSRPSSNTTSKYVHYQATLPEKNCAPSRSGNYLLKVFINSNEDEVVFTKRMYVVQTQVEIGTRILQPFNYDKQLTHQKIAVTLNTVGIPKLFNPAQSIKTVIMQNQRWDNALTNLRPAFIRETSIEYDAENDCLFEAGKEYRWADLRSFRFESDRILRKDESREPIDVYMKTDGTRNGERYINYRDVNSRSVITTTDLVNNWWQTGYANVHFIYQPERNQAYSGQDVYLAGEFTGSGLSNDSKMTFNVETGVYEKTLLLKQGFYSYNYITKPKKIVNAPSSTLLTEGNYWETENNYTIFVYYRSFSGRYDELVGFTNINSRFGRQ